MLGQVLLCLLLPAVAADELDDLPLLTGGIKRISSYDRDAGDQDFFQVSAGNSIVLADIKGAGTIKRLYIKVDSDDPAHLRSMVLRFYWDGSRDACVEAPLGDFFGCGHGRYRDIDSAALVTGHKRGLTCYFPMPFHKRALMVLVNEGRGRTNRVFYQIDYEPWPPMEFAGLFHAQYQQGVLLRSSGNYILLHAKGRGKFVGAVLSIALGEDGLFWEGDEKVFIDNEDIPSIQGTGLDDYFGGAWGFTPGFSSRYFGTPAAGDLVRGAEFSGYRFHIPDPISFSKEIVVVLEHRGQHLLSEEQVYEWASRNDEYYSVAYWYQNHPHHSFAVMPYAAERLSGERRYMIEAESTEVVESSGDALSHEVLDGGTVMVFRADAEGDAVTLRTFVAATGSYEIAGTFLRSRRCGTYRLNVNGAFVGGEKDFFNERGGKGRHCKVLDDKVVFGKISLSSGEVRLRFTAQGRNALSEGFHLGIDSLILRPVE